MNKIKVGNAPPPNLRQVRSKIGSLDNAAHKPGGGKIKIETKKLEFNVNSRIEAKNDTYAPKGGERKVIFFFQNCSDTPLNQFLMRLYEHIMYKHFCHAWFVYFTMV